MPAIGQFFVQNTEKQTYYPIADVFLTAKSACLPQELIRACLSKYICIPTSCSR
ncbi:MAG: hypothetical protein IPN94_06665 [Sphingobacteriales bacterium]|nr:hypothetical protein [Sphingobacteriales bacterium]